MLVSINDVGKLIICKRPIGLLVADVTYLIQAVQERAQLVKIFGRWYRSDRFIPFVPARPVAPIAAWADGRLIVDEIEPGQGILNDLNIAEKRLQRAEALMIKKGDSVKIVGPNGKLHYGWIRDFEQAIGEVFTIDRIEGNLIYLNFSDHPDGKFLKLQGCWVKKEWIVLWEKGEEEKEVVKLKIGDLVKIVKKHGPDWFDALDKTIGKTSKVEAIIGDNYILSNGYAYKIDSLEIDEFSKVIDFVNKNAERWMAEANRNPSVSNWVEIFKGLNSEEHFDKICHADLNYSRRKHKNNWLAVVDFSNHANVLKKNQLDSFKEISHYILNRSPWAPVFFTKNIDGPLIYDVNNLDADHMLAAITAIRLAKEFSDRIAAWDAVKDMDISEHAKFLVMFMFSESKNGYFVPSSEYSGHEMISRQSEIGSICSFFVNGWSSIKKTPNSFSECSIRWGASSFVGMAKNVSCKEGSLKEFVSDLCKFTEVKNGWAVQKVVSKENLREIAIKINEIISKSDIIK